MSDHLGLPANVRQFQPRKGRDDKGTQPGGEGAIQAPTTAPLTKEQGVELIDASEFHGGVNAYMKAHGITREQVQQRADFHRERGLPDENGSGDPLELLAAHLMDDFLVDALVEKR